MIMLLIDLHWLPARYRILYKIYLLAYKCIKPALFAHPEELKSLVSTDSKSTSVTYFRSSFWVFGFLICFLSRLLLQLEDFLLKRKVSNARFFLLVQIARF